MCRKVWARLKYGRQGKEINESMEQCLEAEQKSSYKTVLESAGAANLSQKILSDIYMDTQDLVLPKQDMWLRKMGTQWELRIPAGVGGRNIGRMTQYVEVEGREEVIRELARMEDDGWSVGEVKLIVKRKEEVETAR